MTSAQKNQLDEPIGSLELSVRTANALDGAGVLTIRQLLHSCPTTLAKHQQGGCHCGRTGFEPFCHLLDIPNFGEKTLTEVYAALARIGFFREGAEPVRTVPKRSAVLRGAKRRGSA